MSARRSRIARVLPNRRAFLRGAAGAAVALPFLESVPERSAWAAGGAQPVFAFFLCSVGGVVRAQFFPDATGPLTQAGLAAAGKSTSQLASHADNLLFLSGINWLPMTSQGDAHVNTLCTALTATAPVGAGDVRVTAGGPSADTFIAAKVHPEKSPIALYAGYLRNGYAAQRLSFAGRGQLNPVLDNPYDLYRELMGLATPAGDQAAQRLLQSRKSVHDLVREELTSLMQHPRLGAADRQRLQQHFDAIRDAETTMGGMCSSAGLDVTSLEALQTFKYNAHRTDEMVRLHMSLVAMAFACNYRRAASLQWGDPYDFTVYDVPSNADRQWKFSFISHRAQSDSAAGTDISDPIAAQAHAEIDVARMKTLAAGLEHFKARGLADRCVVMWTVNYAEGPSHSILNVPHIVWGSGGGFLKQGQYVDAGGTRNNRLLNTLISAALQDTHTTVENFGEGPGGMLDVARR